MTTEELNRVTGEVIKAAVAVHKEMGPGLLESVYEKCMIIELRLNGLNVQSQVPVDVRYREQVIEEGFRMDLLVEDGVVVELKSVDEVRDVHKKQLLTYLKLSRKKVGLLINFNERMVKNGITRIVNGLDE